MEKGKTHKINSLKEIEFNVVTNVIPKGDRVLYAERNAVFTYQLRQLIHNKFISNPMFENSQKLKEYIMEVFSFYVEEDEEDKENKIEYSIDEVKENANKTVVNE